MSAPEWMSPGELRLFAQGSQAFGLAEPRYDSIPITETVKFPGGKIQLFTLNGRWGYALAVSTIHGGFGYGAFLKFCSAHPSREAALLAACDYILRREVVQGHRLADKEPDLRRAIQRIQASIRQPRLF